MSVNLERTVGQWAAEHPLSTRVFARHRIDFCCGGGEPLAQVCERQGLDSTAILNEILAEIGDAPAAMNWQAATAEDVIDHILEQYHKPLWEELPRLSDMAHKVLLVHEARDPERLGSLVREVDALREELEQHMAKEERVLFPMIRSGRGAHTEGPIRVMLWEHDAAAEALQRIRGLTGDYQIPDGACTTWRGLWHGLEALEMDLHRHIHLENHVLFPKVERGR